METLYEGIAEILEVDAVSRDDVLDNFEGWDSLSVLSLLAMLDAQFNVRVTSEEIANLVTIGDIVDLVQAKMAAHG